MKTHYILRERVSTQLSETTHKIRAKLLVASSTGIVVFHTGLVPEKIDGLGIEFSIKQQNAIIICLLGLVIFLFISFFISMAADTVSFRLQRKGSMETAMFGIVDEVVEKTRNGDQQANAWYSVKKAIGGATQSFDVSPTVVKYISHLRFFWEVIMPICVSLYAIIVLVAFATY